MVAIRDVTDRVLLTLAEAADRLDPEVGIRTLQRLAAAGRLQRYGERRSGPGRPAALYDSSELDRVHAEWVNARVPPR